MSVRKALFGGIALSVTAGIGWVAVGGTVRPPEHRDPPLPYRAGGVTVSRVPSGGLRSGETAEGARDDLLVQNGMLSYVMGAAAGRLDRGSRYGALLDLALKDFRADELVELRPVARVAGKWLSLNVARVAIITTGKYPYLSVEQVTKDGQVRMSTDFRAAPDSSRIEIISRFHNSSQSLLRAVELGERTRWPGAPTFAPRVGFPSSPTRAEVSWVARQGLDLSYALAFPQGPVEAQFFFDRIGPLGQETMAGVGDAPPLSVLTYRRELSVVAGNLGHAAALAFKGLGRAVGRIQGRLDPAPAWAVIEARYPDGKPALSVRADREGRYTLPVPTGNYVVALRSPGGVHESQVGVQADGPPVDPRLIAPEPGRLRYAITDADGAASPARLILRGVPPTKDPELEPFNYGAGAKNVVFTRTGQGEVELPAGRYRVVATRGPEYEIIDQEVVLDGQTGAAVYAVLHRSVETGGWVSCDFHLHAAPSHDSGVVLDDRVLSLLAEGVEFAVSTDHNHVTDYAPMVARLAAEQLLATSSGVEITTDTWGHFNAFPYSAEAELPPFNGVAPVDLFATVRARAPGAVIQVNHPRMPGIGYFNRIELNQETGHPEAEGASLDFDAIEVVNGYDLEDPRLMEQNLREYFALLNFGYRYAATGNSDSHRMTINWAGYPRTYVRVMDDQPDKLNANEVARAISEGRVQVSNGIFLAIAVNGTASPGDIVSGRRIILQVEARAPSWVDVRSLEVWVNGALVASPKLATRVRGRPAIFQTELDVPEDAWLVVVARGEQPMSSVFLGRRVLPFAFTNPVWIDADEDGTLTPLRAPQPEMPQ